MDIQAKEIQALPSWHPSPEVVATQKAKHKHLCLVDVPEVEQAFLFRLADRKTLSAVATIAAKDPVEAAYIMVVNTLVWGDKSALEDTRTFAAVSEQVERANEPRVATLKNL